MDIAYELFYILRLGYAHFLSVGKNSKSFLKIGNMAVVFAKQWLLLYLLAFENAV